DHRRRRAAPCHPPRGALRRRLDAHGPARRRAGDRHRGSAPRHGRRRQAAARGGAATTAAARGRRQADGSAARARRTRRDARRPPLALSGRRRRRPRRRAPGRRPRCRVADGPVTFVPDGTLRSGTATRLLSFRDGTVEHVHGRINACASSTEHQRDDSALDEQPMKVEEQKRVRIAGELHDGLMHEMLAAIHSERSTMPTITTKDGTTIFYKDWGTEDAQPLVFHHGRPLSADEWDPQMLFFLSHGYRVIAHDRRGHGRSSQTDAGNEMDTYASDVAELVQALDLKNAIHIGHSTGGGEVARYVARAEPGRVAKAVLIGAVPPIMLKTAANPGGLPIEVFDGFRSALAANRAQFFIDVPSGPFYGFNRSGAKVSQGLIDNWWRQGMMGGAKAQYDCIKAFSETDFTEDLKAIDI